MKLKRNYWEIFNFPDSPELWEETELTAMEELKAELNRRKNAPAAATDEA